MRTTMKMLTVLRAAAGGGVAAPVNTVAPAITGTAEVGETLTVTDGTWDGEPTSYAYQWKRDGVVIAGATSSSYQVQFDDLLAEITATVTAHNAGGGTAADSDTTSPVNISAYSYAPTLGAELLTNGDFSSGSAGANPPGWTVGGESGTDPDALIVAPDGSAGTGACKLSSSATNFAPALQQAILSTGLWYRIGVDIKVLTSSTVDVRDLNLGFQQIFNSTGVKAFSGRASGSTFSIFGRIAPISFVIDDATVKNIPMTQAARVRDFGVVNGTFAVKFTRTATFQVGAAHYVDADNYVLAYNDGGNNLLLIKRVGGVTTQVATAGANYSANALLELIRGDGTYTVKYNGVTVHNAAAVTDTVFYSATKYGLFTTDPNATFTDAAWTPA